MIKEFKTVKDGENGVINLLRTVLNLYTPRNACGFLNSF